jgi:hypothetical protein
LRNNRTLFFLFVDKKWRNKAYFFRTSLYFSVLFGTSRYFSVLLGTSRYFLVLLGTSRYFSVLLGTSRYFSVLLGTSWYFFVLLYFGSTEIRLFPLAKISFLEHSGVFLSLRKRSGNQFIDERYLVSRYGIYLILYTLLFSYDKVIANKWSIIRCRLEDWISNMILYQTKRKSNNDTSVRYVKWANFIPLIYWNRDQIYKNSRELFIKILFEHVSIDWYSATDNDKLCIVYRIIAFG